MCVVYSELESLCESLRDKHSQNEQWAKTCKQNMEVVQRELEEKKEMIMVLVSKQAAILRDRYLLGQEIQLLRTQLVGAE